MKAEGTVSAKTNHIPQLDGLRGIAILLVITYHYFGFLKIFSFGWAGVDLFFVLSGYLITSRLLDSLNKPNYFRNFYTNRALRIFPLYYLVLIAFFLAVLILPKNQHIASLSYYTQHWTGYFFFFQNWTMIFFGLPKEQYLIHFWSLAVEEQFYIVWPLIIYLVRNNKKLFRILSGLFFLAIILRFIIYFNYPHTSHYGYSYFYNSFCRMDTLIIGGIISIAEKQKIILAKKTLSYLLWGSFFLVLSGILFFQNDTPLSPFFSTIGYSIVAIMYAAILNKSLRHDSMFHKALKNSFLQFCGKISYGLYIFHWLILLVFNARMYNWALAHLTIHSSIIKIFCGCICLLLTFAVSWSSYTYFESYFLRLKYSHTDNKPIS